MEEIKQPKYRVLYEKGAYYPQYYAKQELVDRWEIDIFLDWLKAVFTRDKDYVKQTQELIPAHWEYYEVDGVDGGVDIAQFSELRFAHKFLSEKTGSDRKVYNYDEETDNIELE